MTFSASSILPASDTSSGADSRSRRAVAPSAFVSDMLHRTRGTHRSRCNYHQSGIVRVVRPERHHCDTAWQAARPAGPPALLPLPEGGCSITWSIDRRHAEYLLHASGFADGLPASTARRPSHPPARLPSPSSRTVTILPHRATGRAWRRGRPTKGLRSRSAAGPGLRRGR